LKIKILEKDKEKMKFIVEGTSSAFANALRRTMISEVPTMSVDWVDYQENRGALFDEMIAHRLGLIPLTYEVGKYNLPDKCICGGKGCPLCQVTLVLDKKGPCVVMSGDLKSTDENVKPVYDNIPITQLDKNQEIKLDAIARLGLGKNHAKNQAAVAVCIPYPKIEIDSGVSAKKIVNAFPKGILSLSGTKVNIDNPFKVDEFKDVLENFKGKARIKTYENKFIFSVETACGLAPEQIVGQAVKIVGEKAAEFKKLIAQI